MAKGYKETLLSLVQEGLLDKHIGPFKGLMTFMITHSSEETVKRMVGHDPDFHEKVDNAFRVYREELRKEAVNKRFWQLERNTGYSMSWLRRLNKELEAVGLDLTHRKVVKYVMDNNHLYPTWDDVKAGIITSLNNGAASKRSVRAYEQHLTTT